MRKVKFVAPKEKEPAAKTVATPSDGETAERMRKATKPAKLPTLEQIVAKLKQHGIHFDQE